MCLIYSHNVNTDVVKSASESGTLFFVFVHNYSKSIFLGHYENFIRKIILFSEQFKKLIRAAWRMGDHDTEIDGGNTRTK